MLMRVRSARDGVRRGGDRAARVRCGARKGVTLLETLIVVGLLAVATAVLAGGLGSGSAGASLRDAAGRVRDLDARARLKSAQGRTLVLTVEEAGEAVVLRSVGNQESNERIGLPSGVAASLSDLAGAPVERIEYSLLGRSRDFLVGLTTNRIGAVDVRFAGLTGWSEIVRREGGSP